MAMPSPYCHRPRPAIGFRPRPGRSARGANRVAVLAVTLLAGCGGAAASVSPSTAAGTGPPPAAAVSPARPAPAAAGAARPSATTSTNSARRSTGPGPAAAAAAATRAPSYPVVRSFGSAGPAWRLAVTIRGHPAAWIARRNGVTLLRIDQHRARLALHAGSLDPGPGPWRYGDAIVGRERRHLVAAFNGGFRLNTHTGGWQSYGRTPVALTDGLASIVTYRDGTTDIGAWHQGVPASRPIASVRQNLHLLIDHGAAAGNLDSCLQACWGPTLGGRPAVARAAIAVTGGRMLLWAGTFSATPATLARALISAGAERAAELDINPSWVAGYLYHHGGGPITELPVVPGQFGVAGHFLTPYTRDFFSVIAR